MSNLFTRISGCVGTLIRSSRLLEVLPSKARYRWRSIAVASFCVSVRTLREIVLWGTVTPGSALRTSLVPYRLKNEDHFICKLSVTPTQEKCTNIKRLLQLLTYWKLVYQRWTFCSQLKCLRVELPAPFDTNGNLQLRHGLKTNLQVPLRLKRNLQVPLVFKMNLQIPLGLKGILKYP
jgi:hypothetical protein